MSTPTIELSDFMEALADHDALALTLEESDLSTALSYVLYANDAVYEEFVAAYIDANPGYNMGEWIVENIEYQTKAFLEKHGIRMMPLVISIGEHDATIIHDMP